MLLQRAANRYFFLPFAKCFVREGNAFLVSETIYADKESFRVCECIKTTISDAVNWMRLQGGGVQKKMVGVVMRHCQDMIGSFVIILS